MGRESAREKIICSLATEGPQTPYAIAKKAHVHNSAVHRIIKDKRIGLDALSIVVARSSEKWRTGLRRSEYTLTFRGMMNYLCLCHESQTDRSRVIRAIERHRDLCPLFEEHQFLAKWLGDDIYPLFALAGWDVERGHVPSPTTAKRLEMLRRMEMPIDKKEKEQFWIHAFSITFLNLIGDIYLSRKKIKRMSNEKLYGFFKEIIDRERKSLTSRLSEFNKWDAILKQTIGRKKGAIRAGGEKRAN